MGKARVWIWVAACIAIAALGLAQTREGDLLLYNHSASIPRGLYVRIHGQIELASVVTVRAVDVAPTEARRRGFDLPGDRFLKRVAAVGGDIVCAHGDTIEINDQAVVQRAQRDSAGFDLSRWEGCRALSSDEVFLLGDTGASFDGRYWGPISRGKIEGVWRPLAFRPLAAR